MSRTNGKPSRGGFVTLLTALAFATFSSPCALGADNPILQQAIKDYNSKSYKDALEKLQTLPRTGQGSDKAHYYMALCYQATNQIGAATTEYNTVYRNSKDSTLRYNSAVALQGLQKWGQHRAYAGNGNNFARSGGGGAPVRRSGGG